MGALRRLRGRRRATHALPGRRPGRGGWGGALRDKGRPNAGGKERRRDCDQHAPPLLCPPRSDKRLAGRRSRAGILASPAPAPHLVAGPGVGRHVAGQHRRLLTQVSRQPPRPASTVQSP